MFSITDKTAAPQCEQFYCFKLIFPTLVYRNSRYNQFLYMQLYIVTALFIPRAYLTGCILMNILSRSPSTFSPIRFFLRRLSHARELSALWIINNRFWINYSRMPTETDCPEDLSGNRYTRSGTISEGSGAKGVAWYDRNIEYQYTSTYKHDRNWRWKMGYCWENDDT